MSNHLHYYISFVYRIDKYVEQRHIIVILHELVHPIPVLRLSHQESALMLAFSGQDQGHA